MPWYVKCEHSWTVDSFTFKELTIGPLHSHDAGGNTTFLGFSHSSQTGTLYFSGTIYWEFLCSLILQIIKRLAIFHCFFFFFFPHRCQWHTGLVATGSLSLPAFILRLGHALYPVCWIFVFAICVLSRSLVFNSCNPINCNRFLCPWDSLGKNTRVGCHFLLQGIFLTQKSNLGLLNCRQTLYRLSYKGSPFFAIYVLSF